MLRRWLRRERSACRRREVGDRAFERIRRETSWGTSPFKFQPAADGLSHRRIGSGFRGPALCSLVGLSAAVRRPRVSGMSGETHCTKKDEGQAAIGFFVFGFSFFVNVQWLHTGPYPGYGGGVLGPDQRCIQRVRCSGQVKRPGSPVLFSVLGRGLFFFAIC